MKRIILLTLSLMCIFTCFGQKIEVDGYYNDGYFRYHTIKSSLKLRDQGKLVSRQELYKQRQSKYCSVKYTKKINRKNAKDIYNQCKESVLILNSIYVPGEGHKAKNCHASGFFINNEGICVSNAHVFNKLNDDRINIIANTVTDCEGNTYPVTEILATDVDNDVCIFKVKIDKKVKSLPLNPNVNVGDKTYILSNAADFFYTLTEGILTRKYVHYVNKNKTVQKISTSAEFCKGSSGSPLLDENGNVIGVISSTKHIMAPNNKHQQMIVKECIPIQKVIDMIN